MSFAAPQTLRPLNAPNAETVRAAFARVEVFDDPARALDAWRALPPETCGSFYQSETFLLAWLAVFAAREQAKPFFILARDEAGAPLALLPLGLFRLGPLRVAQFLGAKHSNYNLGLFRPDRAFSAQDLRALLSAAARAVPRGPHLYRFLNLPLTWRGSANALTLLPHRAAASRAHATTLGGDGDAFLAARLSADARKRLRQKEKRLAAMGALRAFRAANADEADKILDAYFAHKDGRAVHPVAPADIAATRAFYRSLALGAGAAPPIELHALALDGKIIAVLGAGRNGGRLQGMFISYDPDPDIARSSPGELLLCAVLRDACARNLSSFDLGVGDARYKTTFCDESERLVEALYAPTWAGRLAAPFFALASAAKAEIKHNPRLFALARRARGL
jgi:CelD/BcsL family acetyltransferase involved in cellulose biosynthesis